MSMLLKLQIVHIRTTHHRAENRRFSTLKRTKTDDTQPKLNAVCFVVQSCLTDADFVISSNYCLIGTRGMLRLFFGLVGQLEDQDPLSGVFPRKQLLTFDLIVKLQRLHSHEIGDILIGGVVKEQKHLPRRFVPGG